MRRGEGSEAEGWWEGKGGSGGGGREGESGAEDGGGGGQKRLEVRSWESADDAGLETSQREEEEVVCVWRDRR